MTPTEYFKWWTVDKRTGERRTTTYKLSREEARSTFPGARPILETREIRFVAFVGEADSPHTETRIFSPPQTPGPPGHRVR